MTKQRAISIVMVAKMSKERMSKHHHLEFWLMNLKQTVQQLQAKKNKRMRFSTIRSQVFTLTLQKKKKTILIWKITIGNNPLTEECLQKESVKFHQPLGQF